MNAQLRTIILVGLLVLASGGLLAQQPSEPKLSIEQMRHNLVDKELTVAGITNARVLKSMRDTPRHDFVPPGERKNAYYDMALPIGEKQTISPPFVVAYMTQELDPQPEDVVLEIGTGSGYQAAVLSSLVKDVYTIEIVEKLGQKAAKVFKRHKYENVHAKIGDGYKGWPEHAPFDKIIVTCSPENVPQALVEQLKEGGRMIVPLGERYQQILYLYKKVDGKLVVEALRPTLFVPMTGEAEAGRKTQPDPDHPKLLNGSFEEIATEGAVGLPTCWHHLFQCTLVEDDRAPEGKHYVRFSNRDPGRGAQGFQGFAINGKKINALQVSLDVAGTNIRPGRDAEQLPMLMIIFYDEKRSTVSTETIGPWRGSFEWQHEDERIEVPARAREAIVRMGMFGATGEIMFDVVELKPAEKEKKEKKRFAE